MVVFLSGARYFGKLEVRRAESIKKASESLEECCKMSCCEIKNKKRPAQGVRSDDEWEIKVRRG